MEELLKILIKNKINFDQLSCLHSIDGVIGYPHINYERDCKWLEENRFIRHDDHYVVTAKGKDLLSQVNRLFNKRKKATDVVKPDTIENIKKYIDLFPIGRQGSQPIRTAPKMLIDRFQWFFSEYDYTWEEILSATEQYVKACEPDYKFIKTAKNFIKKEDTIGKRTVTSILADWCESIRNNEVVVRGSKYFGENIV